MQTYGTPAAFARRKRNSIFKIYAILLVVLVVVAVTSLYVFINSQSTLHYGGSVIGIIVSGFIVIKLLSYNTDLAKLNSGILAEKKTVNYLKKTKYSFLVNGAVLGKIGDLDHLVIGPICAVIETKYGKGPVYVRDNTLYVNNKILFKDPVTQVKQQASVFSSKYRVPVRCIVCISDGKFAPFEYKGVIICNPNNLNNVLNSFPSVISLEDSKAIVKSLKLN